MSQILLPMPEAANIYKHQIANAIVTCQFHNHTFRYIRRGDLIQATNDRLIRTIVYADVHIPANPPSIRTDLIQRIKQHGTIMFAICVHEKLSMEFLSFLLDKNVTDESLPLPESSNQPDNFTRFIHSQWFATQPPILHLHDFTKVIAQDSLMPINFENADPIGRGAQGKVYKVRIDKRYCGFSAQVGALNHPTFSKELALKVVRIRNQDQRERNFLEFLSTSQIMQHDHITRTYTGFEFNGNDYFISELAQTSLTSFMSDDANARAADVDLKWLRSQFIGLAEALARMHGPSLGQQAYHHDIKPDNILVFSPRILKLTDWGCAGFKPVPAGGGSQSTQKRGQFPHLPPEHVGINAATSRPHDVWSLACVFTEMLFWFYHGTQATQQLKKTTHALDDTGPPKRGCWFSNNPAPSDNNPPTLADRFKLAPTIDTALTNLGTLRPNMRSLEKILRKMFEIIPGERIKADVVVQELRNMPN